MPSAGSERPIGTKKAKAARKATSSCSMQELVFDFMHDVSSSSTHYVLRDQRIDESWTSFFEVQNDKLGIKASKLETKRIKVQTEQMTEDRKIMSTNTSNM